MNYRAVVPFLALVFGFATLMLNAEKVKHVSANPTSPASGSQMFSEYCAVCHGKDAKGNGPAASALKKPPSDLTMLSSHNNGKFPENQVFGAIKGDAETPAHGSKDMPVWGAVFSQMAHGNIGEQQLRITNLTKYIEGLQGK